MGSAAPQTSLPWERRDLATLFARVPSHQWVDVSRGLIFEYRIGRPAVKALLGAPTPMPAVFYRHRPGLGYDSKLMVLQDVWEEPLGAATPEAIERMGFESFGEFRRDWISHNRTLFEPLRVAGCVRVKPMDLALDPAYYGKRLIEFLYDGHLG